MNVRKLRYWILLADLVWVALALIIAWALRFGIGSRYAMFRAPFVQFGGEFLATAVCWIILYESVKLDGFHGGWRVPAVVSRLFLGVLALMGIVLASAYLAHALVSRLVLSFFGVLIFLGFLAIRVSVHRMFSSKFAVNACRRVVIVGSGPIVRELGTKIDRHPEALRKVIGYLTPDDTYNESSPTADVKAVVGVRTVGIIDLLKNQNVQEIIIVGSTGVQREMINLAARCRTEGIDVSLVPSLYELYLSKPKLLDLDGLPVLQLPHPEPMLMGAFKRGADCLLGSILSVAALPVIIVAGVLLRLQKGRAFRWEVRCGLYGTPFRMLRLNVDRKAPDLTGAEGVIQDLSVSELPQLWNVLKGEMSLVGPRPEDPQRVNCYSDWERQRLTCKPGITGLAQVYGLREYHSSEEKCRFDLQYLLDCSPFLDLSLLLQTVWTLVGRFVRGRQLSSQSTQEISLPPTALIQEIMPGAHRTQSSAD